MSPSSAADSGIWTGRSSNMYRPGCNARGLHGFWCLSLTGAIFLACTYTGFALLVAGEALLPPHNAGLNLFAAANLACKHAEIIDPSLRSAGVFWQVDFIPKVRAAWRQIRNRNNRKRRPAVATAV